jgi:hypothetical protein
MRISHSYFPDDALVVAKIPIQMISNGYGRKWLAALAACNESRSFPPISALLVGHGAGSAPSSRLELRKKSSRNCIVIFATVH